VLVCRGGVRVTREVIAQAPRLLAIATTAAGTDFIDVDAATERGIPVINGAGAAPDGVAEFALGAIIAAHRGFLAKHQALTTGALSWRDRLRDRRLELTGTTLGIVGFGYIGRALARMAIAAFGVHVLAYDPVVSDAAMDGVEMVESLEDLLRRSDSVSIHAPLTDATRGLFGKRELRLIGPRGVLVNSGRGAIVDQTALVEVLHAGELGGAVLDTFASEPPSRADLELLAGTPNLLLSPHVAGCTDQTRGALERNVVDQIVLVLAGKAPTRLANPEALGSLSAIR